MSWHTLIRHGLWYSHCLSWLRLRSNHLARMETCPHLPPGPDQSLSPHRHSQAGARRRCHWHVALLHPSHSLRWLPAFKGYSPGRRRVAVSRWTLAGRWNGFHVAPRRRCPAFSGRACVRVQDIRFIRAQHGQRLRLVVVTWRPFSAAAGAGEEVTLPSPS